MLAQIGDPRVVALDKTGQNQRVPVRVFNMSAKTITVMPHTTLCELQDVKVLRHIDIGQEETEDTARMSTQTVDKHKASLPDGVTLGGTDLSPEEKERATHMFCKWDSIFSKDSTDNGQRGLSLSVGRNQFFLKT